MPHRRYILSIDQGTTSSRAVLFDTDGHIAAAHQKEFRQHFPRNGWVEHDPEEIWETTRQAIENVFAEAGNTQTIEAMGITNQRETTIIWDRSTGKPIYNAIVWQDRRTAAHCDLLKQNGVQETISAKTGLLPDPYFSATKIAWILENVDGAGEKARKGRLAFGTVDTFLIWRLTAGKHHCTDATNASRTMLYNIHTGQWDRELLTLFKIPESLLPEVKNSADNFGLSAKSVLSRELPIAGVAGDQQAALFGQTCFSPGMVKSTFGTGCFMMMNTGKMPLKSTSQLLTTIGYQIDDQPVYALEGAVFNAGTAIQWIRDGLGLIDSTDEIEGILQSAGSETENSQSDAGLYLVPAFTGLGAPHWDPDARGMMTGITRDTTRADLVTAALESVCYQTNDLVAAMLKDSETTLSEIRVDGGMTANRWMLRRLADLTRAKVIKPIITETTALGVAYLAGLQQGIYESPDSIAEKWKSECTYYPQMREAVRALKIKGWNRAVKKCLL